jgi:hypothetical protein
MRRTQFALIRRLEFSRPGLCKCLGPSTFYFGMARYRCVFAAGRIYPDVMASTVMAEVTSFCP